MDNLTFRKGITEDYRKRHIKALKDYESSSSDDNLEDVEFWKLLLDESEKLLSSIIERIVTR